LLVGSEKRSTRFESIPAARFAGDLIQYTENLGFAGVAYEKWPWRGNSQVCEKQAGKKGGVVHVE
jgi:hypothetical protein